MVDGLNIEQQIGAHEDEPLVNVLACRREIADYLQNIYQPPTDVAHSACVDLNYVLRAPTTPANLNLKCIQ